MSARLVRVARVAAHVVVVAVVGVVVVGAFVAPFACELPPADYGRPCDDRHVCTTGYQCFQQSCVPNDYPLLDHDGGPVDAGPSDAGPADAG